LSDDNDGGSGHHFNMMIGSNYSADDASAFVATGGRDYYNPNAEDMVTIAFAQMDSTALFHMYPPGAMMNSALGPQASLDGDGLFGDFSWNPYDFGTNPTGDMGDALVNAARGGNGKVTDKLDLILKVIDGGTNVSDGDKMSVFLGASEDVVNPTGFDRINKMRANIGAMINRLEHTVNNLMNQETNTQAAESVLRDADFASETAAFTRSQILSQSSTAMLAQANTLPQSVLQLLQ